MFKKIILWSIYALFVGGLVWAAINRTSRNLGGSTQATQAHDTENINLGEIAIYVENTDIHEQTWVILDAEISELSNRSAVIKLANNTSVTLNPRAWRFTLTQGFQAEPGDMLLVTGFYENEKFEIVHLRNLDNATVAQIRDEDGHPLWSSGGSGN